MVQASHDFKLSIINSEQGRESGGRKSREREDMASAASANGVTAIDAKADLLMSGRRLRHRNVGAWDAGAVAYTAFSSSSFIVSRPLLA
jgi:hypothetical protein